MYGNGTQWNNTKTLQGAYTLSGSLKTNDGVTLQGSLTASNLQLTNIPLSQSNGYYLNINDSNQKLYKSIITGSQNRILKFTSGTTIGETTTPIFENGTNIGIGTTTAAYKLQVSGSIAPVGDGVYPLGSNANRFSDVFATQTTIGGLFETGLKTDALGLLPTGTIVSWNVNGCEPCIKEEDELVMGVVKNGKDEPLIMGAEPILVTGIVEMGDYIVTSNKKGHGKAVKRGNIFKKDLFGKVIAQALENGSGDSYVIKAMIRKM